MLSIFAKSWLEKRKRVKREKNMMTSMRRACHFVVHPCPTLVYTSHAPRGTPYCADCTYYFRTYLSFVYFLILRFMTYVFLHLAATLCTLLAYYLAYPHVSLFPPSVKILYYSSCLSLLPMFLCCPTYANGVLVLFFNLNLIFSSFITRYLERRI